MTVTWQGKRVTVRDLVPEDIEGIYYWLYEAEDREHEKWNGPYGPVEPETLEDFRERVEKGALLDVQEDKPRRWLVVEADGQLIGLVSRYWVDERTKWLEIGIVMYDSRYWSGGYGTEAFGYWIEYLFSQLDVVRLGIATWSGNVRMMGLAAKWGMIEEARVRKARIVAGEFYDSIKMGILREEWEAQREARSAFGIAPRVPSIE